LANIRDVAKRAGVSAASVSRILSGDKTFSASPETRRSVLEAMKELKYVYVPVSNKQNNSGENTKQVGCIITSAFGNHRVALHYNYQLSELERSLSEKGFARAFTVSELELQNEEIFQNTFKKIPSALVYLATIPTELYKRLRTVVPHGIGINCSYPDIDIISFDKEKAIENAVTYLAGRGHKKIAYIGGPGKLKAELSTSRRYRGYLFGLEKNNLPFRSDLVKNCYWLVNTCYAQTSELLNGSEIPDAIICGTDSMVFSIYRAVYEKHLKIPEDIAVFSCEMLPFSQYITPAVTSMEVPVKEMMNTVAELLSMRMNGLSVPTMEIIYRSKMIIQAST
jgi:DNA-binding LacI/PurR family transcriptional regulator